MEIAVVGGGIFGTAASLALAARGHRVMLFDAGRIPRPEAASTDISKLVRMDYGKDTFYRDLGREAIDGWQRWNSQSGQTLYREDGICVLASRWESGGFEYDSHEALTSVGLAPERFDTAPLPVWRWSGPCYLNRKGGWADSAATVRWLRDQAIEQGMGVYEGAPILSTGIVGGAQLDVDVIVVAAGAWTPVLLPQLQSFIRTIAQPTLYLAPQNPERFRPPHFLPFACDVANTGWYGFPADADGIVKIANHGPGTPMAPYADRALGDEWDARLRSFLQTHLPELADAPIVRRRWCIYTDVIDGDFLIDRLPGSDRVVLATGGSGHAFKFAPLLGDLVADRVERRDNPHLSRFAWRTPDATRGEQARAR